MSTLPYETEFDSEFATILNERLPACANDDDVRNLSESDKTVFLIMYFDCQVVNGGIEQWFRNPTGAFTHETLAALDRVGADATAGIVRELHTMFSGVDISQDYEERNTQFDALPAKTDSNNVANYHALKDGTQVLILPDPKRGTTTGYQWSNVTFGGDFEITFDYRDFQSSLPSAKSLPWEAPRVELKTGLGDVFDGPKNTHLLALTHRRRTDETMQLTSLLAILAEPGKFNWQSSDQKAAKPGGRMRIVRRGGSAYYLYAHPGSDDFRLLERKPVPTTDAKGIFVGIRCDHKEDRGSVVLTSLSIRAERMEGTP